MNVASFVYLCILSFQRSPSPQSYLCVAEPMEGRSPAARCSGSKRGRTPTPVARLQLRAGPPVQERLNQGPFDIDQDQGWQTVLFTMPSERHLRRPWLGRLCLGGERSVAGGPGGSGNDRAARREDFESAVRGCALHPLRLAQCPVTSREARPGSGLATYGSVPVGPQD
jgi:hypothetical protein